MKFTEPHEASGNHIGQGSLRSQLVWNGKQLTFYTVLGIYDSIRLRPNEIPGVNIEENFNSTETFSSSKVLPWV